MSQFKDIKDSKDFLPLHAKRTSILVQLTKLKENLEKLKDKETPNAVTFERNEAKIDSYLSQLDIASIAISDYFSAAGGDALKDVDFLSYQDEETTITGEIEILREYHIELLKSHNLLAPSAPPEETVTQSSLLEALKVLAESTGRHASMAEKPAEARFKL